MWRFYEDRLWCRDVAYLITVCLYVIITSYVFYFKLDKSCVNFLVCGNSIKVWFSGGLSWIHSNLGVAR